jgi:hypothetical protein
MRLARSCLVCVLLIATCACLAAGPATAPTTRRAVVHHSTFDFLDNYRIAYYLDCAVGIQKLDPRKRAARLRELADDVEHAPEIYPLCRMLFEAKGKEAFRRPMIGSPFFVDGGDTADWPLEPITLYRGIPILVAAGYSLGGHAEEPKSYLEYCLDDCKWREEKFATLKSDEIKKIVNDFIASNPKVSKHAEILLKQAE